MREPFEGMGKPEPLRENLAGFWSWRIDDTNGSIHFQKKHNYYTLEAILCGLSKKVDLPKADAPDTNRLVYAVEDEYLTIISCRYHYTI